MREITRTARACSGTATDAMRVAVDATPLTLTSGGLARYTSELVLTLTAQFPDDKYHLVSDQIRGRDLAGCGKTRGQTDLSPAWIRSVLSVPEFFRNPLGALERRW